MKKIYLTLKKKINMSDVVVDKNSLLDLPIEDLSKFLTTVIYDVANGRDIKAELTSEGFIKVTKGDELYKVTEEELSEIIMIVKLSEALDNLKYKEDAKDKEGETS